MANSEIATYLNDHLAGSVAGLNMLEHIIQHLEGTPAAANLRSVKSEIESEQEELKGMIEKLGASQSTVRKAGAWLGEKFAELKLRFDDLSGGDFLLFESLEAMSLGIEGKRSLWRALRAAAESDPLLQILDFERLEAQAERQRAIVETLRVQIAVKALGRS